MKKYTVTGKNVFRDNQTGLFYVDLNTGMRITVENNPETMATIAWNEANGDSRFQFLRSYGFEQFTRFGIERVDFKDLYPEMKEKLIEYQKKCMEKKP